MELTKENYYEMEPTILKDIENCEFVAFDLEFSGLIPSKFKIFDSPIEEIKLQVPLLIGNLISNSYGVRDLLIKEKIYDKLLTILTSTNNKNLIKNCTWSITNFFRIKPILKYDLAKKSIKIFARNLLLLQDDFDFLSDACFILCFMTENYKEGIKELMEFNIIEAIIKLLACGVVNIQITCL